MSFNTQRCRFLSHVTWGSLKKHYREKYLALKKNEKVSLFEIMEQIKKIAFDDENKFHSLMTTIQGVTAKTSQAQSVEQKLDAVIATQQKIENLLRVIIQQQEITSRIQRESTIDFYKQQIIECGLFDEDFYIKTYPTYKDSGLSPIDHYLKIGWQMRYNPSADFDTKRYIEKYKTSKINPLLHFVTEGKWRAFYAFSRDSEPLKTIPPHNEKNTRVVYTCILGNYDIVKQYKYIAPGWDYICFTDNEEWLEKKQVGIWTMRPVHQLDLDPTRLNRFHKINPHIVLSEYNESLYIDANINILTSLIFDIIHERSKKENLLLPVHFADKCAYEHGGWILHRHIDISEPVRNFIKIMEENHFPHNYGMTENNIIYRKHHDPHIIDMMTEWWSYVLKYCKRDQLSFSYVLWKNNISIESISFYNARINTKDFKMIEHEKL